VLRRLIQPPDRQRAHLRRRKQVVPALSRAIEPGYRPDSDSCRSGAPAPPPKSVRQVPPATATPPSQAAPAPPPASPPRRRPSGKTGLASGLIQLIKLLVGEEELHQPRSRHRLPCPPPHRAPTSYPRHARPNSAPKQCLLMHTLLRLDRAGSSLIGTNRNILLQLLLSVI
jgi:hypothetical protein